MQETVIPFFDIAGGGRPRAAIFLSGSGSNAERILERCRDAGDDCPFIPVALFTDRPETSRARAIGREFNLPVVENDIRKFYNERGLKRMSIRSVEGRAAREAWTHQVREQLKRYNVTFGILAGFVPLTNITGDFPCLNVHPGDLTYIKGGQRHLVGLHTIPVERAILEGLPSLRSSVIVAQPYEGGGDNMDSGPILGISEEVPIELEENGLEQLIECAEKRPAKRPKTGFGDALEAVAQRNLENLKVNGDWQVFPRVVFDFAKGLFALDANNNLLFRIGNSRHPIKTIIYRENDREVMFG